MNHVASSGWCLLLGLVASALTGCSSAPPPAPPSRESRIQSLAVTVCGHYGDTTAGCPGYGTKQGQKYADEKSCENDFQQQAENLWPVDKCNEGQIDDSRYNTCLSRAETYACSTGVQNALDSVAALGDCNADKVCIDHP
jgi:hypothetical protein